MAGPAQPETAQASRIINVDSNAQLFAVLCALDAAGFDSSVGAGEETQGRIQLRQKLRALRGPAVDALRRYYTEHAVADSAATFSRFVTFALVAGPPPNFQFELRREDLPPEALFLDGFNPILAAFYREAKIGDLWQFYEPDYQRGIDALDAPVSNIVFTVTNYLREILRPGTSGTFSVYVEPLAGGKTIFRTFGSQYAVVVRPSTDLPIDDIRHAFLHFILDPIAIRYQAQAAKGAPLLNYAAHAPLLPVDLRDDYPSFFDECLVRAVEIRLRHLQPAGVAAALDQADATGFVMVRPIYVGLAGFEKSEPAMGYYLPDLIRAIDIPAEQRRVSTLRFADAAPAPQGPEESLRRMARPAAADQIDQLLAEGQRQINARNGVAAAAAFGQVLSARPNDTRATYGLAVASALQGKPEEARELFAKVIAAADSASPAPGAQPDPSNLSWSHIYLGRMYDVEGMRDQAVAEYRAALAVAGAPESARTAAQRGVETGYQPPSRNKPSDGKS